MAENGENSSNKSKIEIEVVAKANESSSKQAVKDLDSGVQQSLKKRSY